MQLSITTDLSGVAHALADLRADLRQPASAAVAGRPCLGPPRQARSGTAEAVMVGGAIEKLVYARGPNFFGSFLAASAAGAQIRRFRLFHGAPMGVVW